MSQRKVTNVAASVAERLKQHAKTRGEEFGFVLTRYGVERLLYRLAQSTLRNRFILKGASLFSLWSDEPHRSTRDVDLLGHGDPSPESLKAEFVNLCGVEVENDGLVFDAASVQAEAIKGGDEYQGVRVKLVATLGAARVPLQIDVGFGDAVTPGPVEVTYPALLDYPSPTLRAYPRESVVAEKYQAMVSLGMANSRMKDFYDLWRLATGFEFSGPTLAAAIKSTFERRRTDLPGVTPTALTDDFADAKSGQWSAFLFRGQVRDPDIALGAVLEVLRGFLGPPTEAIAEGREFHRNWGPGGPWDDPSS